MINPHSMHQFLKYSPKKRIKIEDVEDRIIKYFTSILDDGLNFLRKEEISFFLLILVINREPELVLIKHIKKGIWFKSRYVPEIIGLIDDIPKDLLMKEIQSQGGDLNIDRQYIVKAPTGIIWDWIKEKRNII